MITSVLILAGMLVSWLLMRKEGTLYIGVERESSLFKLLEGFLNAYNRRTDVMEASSDVAVQRKIDGLVEQLEASTKREAEAINKQNSGG